MGIDLLWVQDSWLRLAVLMGASLVYAMLVGRYGLARGRGFFTPAVVEGAIGFAGLALLLSAQVVGGIPDLGEMPLGTRLLSAVLPAAGAAWFACRAVLRRLPSASGEPGPGPSLWRTVAGFWGGFLLGSLVVLAIDMISLST